MVIKIYSDGGCILKNPSVYGGTWACLAVKDEKIIWMKSGFITPADIFLPAVTNNYVELLAAVIGLLYVEDKADWYTDSQVTLRRLTNSKSWAGIPGWLKGDAIHCRGKINNAYLLGGHPTIEELKNGRSREGYPVSIFNKMCDLECTRLSKEYVEKNNVFIR